jgi:lysophospholipase L1-like esterase
MDRIPPPWAISATTPFCLHSMACVQISPVSPLHSRNLLEFDPANAPRGHRDQTPQRRTLANVVLENGLMLNTEITREGYGFADTRFPFIPNGRAGLSERQESGAKGSVQYSFRLFEDLMARLFTGCIILMMCIASLSGQSVAQNAQDRAREKAKTTAAADENRVVFFGDSITELWKLADYFANRPYINRGISGETTSQMLVRFRSDVIKLRPKVVVILGGINDLSRNTGPKTLKTIQGNLASMVTLARDNGIYVVLASLLPVRDYDTANDSRSDQIRRINRWINKYATERGVTYLDYYSAMADGKGLLKDELSNDGLHPNSRGYQVMAPLAAKAITSALKERS